MFLSVFCEGKKLAFFDAGKIELVCYLSTAHGPWLGIHGHGIHEPVMFKMYNAKAKVPGG